MTSQQPPEGLSAENRLAEAVAVAERHAAKWRKRAEKHVRPGGYRSDHQQHDLARAQICDQIAADIALLNAARSTSSAPDPKGGWVLVPREPTEAMIEAMAMAHEASVFMDPIGPMEDAYRAMIAAILASPKAGEREQVAEAEQELREALADNSLAHHVHAQKSAIRTVLSALAEARSDVERVTTDLGWANLRRQEAIDRYMVAEARAEAAEAERDTLAAQLVGAREALEFYGDPGTYHACAFWFDRPTGGFDEDFEMEHGDPDYDRPMPGKRARQALSMSILRGDKGCSLGAIEAPSCGSPADSQTSGGAE